MPRKGSRKSRKGSRKSRKGSRKSRKRSRSHGRKKYKGSCGKLKKSLCKDDCSWSVSRKRYGCKKRRSPKKYLTTETMLSEDENEGEEGVPMY